MYKNHIKVTYPLDWKYLISSEKDQTQSKDNSGFIWLPEIKNQMILIFSKKNLKQGIKTQSEKGMKLIIKLYRTKRLHKLKMKEELNSHNAKVSLQKKSNFYFVRVSMDNQSQKNSKLATIVEKGSQND